jgi:hypothetical protein
MKAINLFLSIILNLVFATTAAVGVNAFIPAVDVATATGAITVIGLFVTQPQGVLSMAIQREIWVDYIMKNLFKDNSLINYVFNESSNVLGGSVVHLPQAGAKPTVVKNRSVYPAVAVQRVDTTETYPLDIYTTDPFHITDAEKMEISYDKMGAVLEEHLLAINEAVTEELLVKWSPSVAARIIRTTGGSSAVTVTATAPSATSTRLKFWKDDLKKAQKLMNKLNIAKADRFAAFPSELLDQLNDDADLIKRDVGAELDMKNGVIQKLYGFNILERGSMPVYNNSAVVKAVGAAGATTDNEAVLCWQKNALAKALGDVNLYDDQGNPLYFGDIYSAMVKMGGRKRRTNEEGIIAIVQA